MASSIFISPFLPALSLTGLIAPMATLTFYASGTSTLAAIYDAAGTALPNPLAADAFGRFPQVYLPDTIAHRVVLKTASGTVLGQVDPLNSAASGGNLNVPGNILLTGLNPKVQWNVGGPRAFLPGIPNTLAFAIGDGSAESIRLSAAGVSVHGVRGSNGDIGGSGNLRVLARTPGGVSFNTFDIVDYTAWQGVRDVGGIAIQVGSITCTDTGTAYNTSSDYRLKDDMRPVDGAWDVVKRLPVINFRWKSNGTRVAGFLAHELAEVVPEAVTGEKDAVRAIGTANAPEDAIEDLRAHGEPIELAGIPEDEAPTGWFWHKTADRDVYQGIDQAKLVPYLVAALQEAMTRIETLEGATP